MAVGGAAGSVARYGVSLLMARWLGMAFPYGTLAVNLIGGFAIGWIAASNPAANTRLLLITGVCGGFTTFSAFGLETVNLLRDGYASRALINVGVSLAGCFAATALGLRVRG